MVFYLIFVAKQNSATWIRFRNKEEASVLHKETRDGADYIRIEYANSQAVALLLAQDTGMEMAGNGSAYIASAAFSLPDFYDRYSPHAYIDYSRALACGHPKPQREYITAERLSRTAGTKALQPLDRQKYTVKSLFQRFPMEDQPGDGTIDRLKVPDINKYILLSGEREEDFGVATEYAHQCYQVLLRAGERRQTRHYGGITRAKEYKSPPSKRSKNEIKRILAQFSNIKHHCMISLVYSCRTLDEANCLTLTPAGHQQ